MDFNLQSDAVWNTFLDNPFEILNPIWTAACDSNQDLDPLRFHRMVKEELEKQVDNQSRCDQIPSLNIPQQRRGLKNKCLLRFRCMIQDMLEGEIVVSSYRVGHGSSKARKISLYSDVVDGDVSDATMEENILLDRSKFYCVSVPGENDWILYQSASSVETMQESPAKRETEEAFNVSKRRKAESSDDSSNSSEKRSSAPPDLCLPLPWKGSEQACIIKVYDQTDLKLNDLVEVFGIVNFESTLEQKKESSDDVEDMFNSLSMVENEENYPYSLIPRIHGLTIKRLTHINPLVKSTALEVFSDRGHFRKVKKELHALLTQALFGDSMAAEYMLYSLISRVFRRHEVVTVGPLAVNLSKFPVMPAETKAFYMGSLYKLLSLITTHSYYLPLSLETLNKTTFIPRKDYTCNKLRGGLLQLPADTLMLIDETALSEGQLQAGGIMNLRALKDLIRWQRIQYDFQFQSNRLEYDTDVNIINISEGNSILPLTTTVPLQVHNPIDEVKQAFDAIFAYLDESLLHDIRKFITLCKECPYELDSEKQSFMEQQLANHIGENNASSIDNLHALMTLTRLISVSEGNTTLEESCWSRAKALEMERLAR